MSLLKLFWRNVSFLSWNTISRGCYFIKKRSRYSNRAVTQITNNYISLACNRSWNSQGRKLHSRHMTQFNVHSWIVEWLSVLKFIWLLTVREKLGCSWIANSSLGDLNVDIYCSSSLSLLFDQICCNLRSGSVHGLFYIVDSGIATLIHIPTSLSLG